jgi:hypothetical protein
MIEVKPDLNGQQLGELGRRMDRIGQALFHAEQAQIHPDESLISLVTERAIYKWLTGDLGQALDGFDKALPMCEAIFGPAHPNTVLMRARRDAVQAETARER